MNKTITEKFAELKSKENEVRETLKNLDKLPKIVVFDWKCAV